ncbi:MAG: hypothetical protein ABSE06_18315 [Anaerolineaceae bacterium]|jgi:hypothetical protein
MSEEEQETMLKVNNLDLSEIDKKGVQQTGLDSEVGRPLQE